MQRIHDISIYIETQINLVFLFLSSFVFIHISISRIELEMASLHVNAFTVSPIKMQHYKIGTEENESHTHKICEQLFFFSPSNMFDNVFFMFFFSCFYKTHPKKVILEEFTFETEQKKCIVCFQNTRKRTHSHIHLNQISSIILFFFFRTNLLFNSSLDFFSTVYNLFVLLLLLFTCCKLENSIFLFHIGKIAIN